ncbi:MAG: PAS domain S-box protein [Rhodomicrobium sp.]
MFTATNSGTNHCPEGLISRRTELMESEALFRATFENAAVGIAHVAPDGSFLRVNNRLCEIIGYPAGELVTKTFQEITHPEDREANLAHLQRALDGEVDCYSMEKRYLRKDGSVTWARLTVGCVRDADRTLEYFVSVVEDISERKRAELALRESRQDLEHAQALARTGSWRLDVGRGEITMSGELRRLFGEMKGPPTYKKFLAATHPGDRERIGRNWKAALKGAPYDIECRLIVGGKTTWVHVRAELQFDGRGRLLSTFGTVQDISDKKEAEEQLRESEERLRLSNEAAGIGTFTTDLESGLIQNSPELAAMLGVSKVTVTIEEAFARVHRDDVARVHAQYEAALRGEGAGKFKVDFRFVRPGGEIRWFTRAGRVDFRDGPAGRIPFRVVGACVDSTERMKAEEAVRASEERFRGIFEYAATGIAILDLEGRFESCNPAYSAMVGYTEEELRGLNFREVLHPDDREFNLAENRRLLAQEIPSFGISNRLVRKDGTVIWRYKHVSLLRNAAGTPARIISLVTDMTERKRHEEHITLLMREVNHRSKNMLAVVQSIARQTAATKPEEFVERFEERIRALAASQDLLIKNDWRGVGLDELVRLQLAHFNDLIGKRIDLRGPSLVISAPAAQTIGLVMHELATNAGKYGALSTGDGRVDIEWSVKCVAAGKETFLMCWRECGGPPVRAPSKQGFGSTVISRMAVESLDAHVELGFPATGFSWQLECPAVEVMEGNSSTSSA